MNSDSERQKTQIKVLMENLVRVRLAVEQNKEALVEYLTEERSEIIADGIVGALMDRMDRQIALSPQLRNLRSVVWVLKSTHNTFQDSPYLLRIIFADYHSALCSGEDEYAHESWGRKFAKEVEPHILDLLQGATHDVNAN